MPKQDYVIQVTWANGEQELLKEGDHAAKFSSRKAAEKQVELMRMGMNAGEVQSINVIPYFSYPKRRDT